MLIELTSKPWKAHPDDYPTVDATIDGDKDQLVQKHPDGSLWMSYMHLSNEGTALSFIPIPEDAMVIDLVHENCLATVAKKARELAETGNNKDVKLRKTLLDTAKACPDYFDYAEDVHRYIEREVNEIVQNETPENPMVSGRFTLDGVDIYVKDMEMSVKEVRNYIALVKENQCKHGGYLHELDIEPAVKENPDKGIVLDYSIQAKFERIRRITGYLTGTIDRWNNAKRAEEHDRVKHTGKQAFSR